MMSTNRIKWVAQFFIFLNLALLMCGAIRAQDVTYNVAPGTDFAKYKTYRWVKIEGAEAPDQIIDQQIKQSIDSQLAAKGFTKTDNENADLYVGYQISINQERQWNAYGGGIGFRGMGTATSSTIQIGTLAFDAYDAAAKQLIWRGSATKTLNPPKDPDKKQKNLDKAVAKLLKDFPPPANKK
jgi:uncharacterized protein DUF4136